MKIALAAVLATTALTVTAASGFAVDNGAPENEKIAQQCIQSDKANTELVAQLKTVEKGTDAFVNLVTQAVNGNPANAMCLMYAVKMKAPELARPVFEALVSFLSTKPEYEDTLRQLTEENEDVVAQIGADVEPAGGPDDAGSQDFGNTPENPGENPNQLNEQDQTSTPPASPSVPPKL